MPAILIHIAFGYIIYRIISHFFPNFQKNIYLFLFLLGSLIPDTKYFVAWITYFIFGNENYYVLSSLFVTHQIFGSLLISLFLSATLFRKIFFRSFLILTIGFLGHFLLDISQYPLAHINHLLLLYPFSGEIFYINLGFFENIALFEILQYVILMIAIIFGILEICKNSLRVFISKIFAICKLKKKFDKK